jgi:hypothetical protein
MTKQRKLILLIVIILFTAFLAYNIFTTTSEGTGSFENFDINSTANKNIKVELVHEKGITPDQQGGVTFFVKDKKGIEKKVTLGTPLPPDISKYKTITLKGHLHGDYFHATEAEVD